MEVRDAGSQIYRTTGWRKHSIFNWQSTIGDRQLVDPSAILRTKDRQFFHHELGLANGADHARPGRGVPFLRHLFTSMTAPALDVSAPREGTAIDLF